MESQYKIKIEFHKWFGLDHIIQEIDKILGKDYKNVVISNGIYYFTFILSTGSKESFENMIKNIKDNKKDLIAIENIKYYSES